MSKKGSSYENIYTQQISEALFDQTGYDEKKSDEKKRIKKQNAATKRQIRAFGGLMVVCFFAAAAYLINLDPANAGPCAIAFGVFLVLSVVIWFMNR